MSERAKTIMGWAILLAVIVSLCLLLIPKKRQESISYQAVQISQEGEILTECTLTWEGKIQKKRFRKESHYSYIAMTVSEQYDFDTETYTNDEFSFWTHPEEHYEYISLAFYHDTIQSFCAARFYRNLEQGWCILIVRDPSGESNYFIGTTHPDLDPMEIYQQHTALFQ